MRAANAPLTIYGVIASGDLDRKSVVPWRWAIIGSPGAINSTRLFRERYSDYIGTYYRPAPDVPTMLPGVVLDFANDDPITIRGLEAQWD